MSKKTELRTTIDLMRQFLVCERGATAIEYAMIAAGIAVAIVAAVSTLGSATNNLFASVAAIFH